MENWSEKIKELSDSWGAGSEKHCAGRAYSFFVNAAYRAGNNSNAQKLIDEAKSTLPENEFKTLMYTAEKLGLEP